jgi:hypothetical protein
VDGEDRVRHEVFVFLSFCSGCAPRGRTHARRRSPRSDRLSMRERGALRADSRSSVLRRVWAACQCDDADEG